MKRLLAAALAALIPAATALGSTPTRSHVGQYRHLYRQVARKFGKRAPGRDIVRWGLASGRAAADRDVVRSVGVLERMLAPPLAPAPVTSTLTVPTSTSGPVGASGVPACASESGTNYSTGPANTNASSGATGRYQITPGTAAAYGCNLATPGGQDACAQVIYAHQGASAWVGCGG